MINHVIRNTSEKDYILIYSAGTGGEFIASAISECTNKLNTLLRVKNENNRWSTNCKIGYSDIIQKEKKLQWDNVYNGENDASKSDLYKDHPVDLVRRTWPRYMTCLFMTVPNNYKKWANLTWKKLHDVNIKITQEEFVEQHAHVIEKEYEQRKIWEDHFERYYEISYADPASTLIQVFEDFDESKFNKMLKEWNIENVR